MTLSHFLKTHQSKIKSALKFKVRDIDEPEKNQFLAYVDDGNTSFDVQITLDTKKNIKDSSCDCEVGANCNHIVALAHFLSENKTEKKVVKKPIKRKLSETDQILETLDNETLRSWLSETLNKNKELAFIFKNNFGNENSNISEDFIKNTIKESITSIIGRRKTIETNEVKKLIDILNISLKPAFDFIFAKVSLENHKLLVQLITKLEEINYEYYISSTRIKTLVKKLMDQQLRTIFNIKDFDAWQKSILLYVNFIFKDKFLLLELSLVKKIYEYSKTNEIQQRFLVNALEENLIVLHKENHNKDFYLLPFELEMFILNTFSENNLFEKHFSKFKPRRFQNDHNLFLINELIKINQLEIAEKYCVEQIQYNSKIDYNIPYVRHLVFISKSTNQKPKLANLLSEYGKFIFSIEDYLFIKENATLEKFKKYRIAVMTNARYSYQNGDIDAFHFYYELKKLDDKRKDLFEMLQNSFNLDFVNHYKEIALQLDEIKFVTLLTRFSFFTSFKENTIAEISDFIIQKIDKEKLIFYLKNVSQYSKNRLIYLIEEKLKKM